MRQTTPESVGGISRAAGASRAPRSVRPGDVTAALLVCLAAPAFFVLEVAWAGWALLASGLAGAWVVERLDRGRVEATAMVPRIAAVLPRPPSLVRDLSLIVIGLAIVRSIPLAAELDNWAMLRFTLALGGAVLVPYLISRFVYRDRATGFPWRGHPAEPTESGAAPAGGSMRWGVLHWSWLATVLVLGWLILPFYFISSGVYQNWPVVDTPNLIARLFVGVNAVGIWDELFFICTVFALLRRHFPDWLANLLQAIVFVSFLWELGYRAWGPLLTIPFALVQGWIFVRTRSLSYVVTVHLLFDAVVFAVLVHAHNPELFNIFPTAP